MTSNNRTEYNEWYEINENYTEKQKFKWNVELNSIFLPEFSCYQSVHPGKLLGGAAAENRIENAFRKKNGDL